MPELPEVEIVKRQLAKSLVNKKLKAAHTSGKAMRFTADTALLSKLKDETVLSFNRRNKYIILETDNLWIVFHLGMSGQLVVRQKFEANYKHEHFTLEFEGFSLALVDPRRFGGFAIYEKSKIPHYVDIPLFKSLGIEPFSKDYTLQALKILLASRKQNIKQFLLDSANICGIGNIYASEILFRSKVSPFKKSQEIKPLKIKSLYNNILEVLSFAIEKGGSSISDFIHVNGQSGNMQNFYKVYARYNSPCFVCGNLIKKEKQFGRTTFFCSHCQK